MPRTLRCGRIPRKGSRGGRRVLRDLVRVSFSLEFFLPMLALHTMHSATPNGDRFGEDSCVPLHLPPVALAIHRRSRREMRRSCPAAIVSTSVMSPTSRRPLSQDSNDFRSSPPGAQIALNLYSPRRGPRIEDQIVAGPSPVSRTRTSSRTLARGSRAATACSRRTDGNRLRNPSSVSPTFEVVERRSGRARAFPRTPGVPPRISGSDVHPAGCFVGMVQSPGFQYSGRVDVGGAHSSLNERRHLAVSEEP